MKSFITIDKFYKSELSKSEMINELYNFATEKKLLGLRIDKFNTLIEDNSFHIQRNTSGVDGFTFEQFPDIKGIIFGEKPLVINIIIKPNYFAILFFALFVFTFIPAGILIDKMIINNVYREPTIGERLFFSGLGGIFPALWCYFGYIRPIKKSEQWIMEKLKLTSTQYYDTNHL